MTTSRRLSRAHGAGLFLLLSLVAGCPDSGNRVYTAASYVAGSGCLQDYAPLGLVVAGDLPANCAPTCLSVGGQVYVSTVCPPFPAEATVLDTSTTDCQQAIAELDAGAFCSLVTSPGSDAAGSDAAADGFPNDATSE